MLLILKNAFNFQAPHKVCFPVSFANTLKYNASLDKSKGYFAQFKHSQVWGARQISQFLWDGSSDFLLQWLHVYSSSQYWWPKSSRENRALLSDFKESCSVKLEERSLFPQAWLGLEQRGLSGGGRAGLWPLSLPHHVPLSNPWQSASYLLFKLQISQQALSLNSPPRPLPQECNAPWCTQEENTAGCPALLHGLYEEKPLSPIRRNWPCVAWINNRAGNDQCVSKRPFSSLHSEKTGSRTKEQNHIKRRVYRCWQRGAFGIITKRSNRFLIKEGSCILQDFYSFLKKRYAWVFSLRIYLKLVSSLCRIWIHYKNKRILVFHIIHQIYISFHFLSCLSFFFF